MTAEEAPFVCPQVKVSHYGNSLQGHHALVLFQNQSPLSQNQDLGPEIELRWDYQLKITSDISSKAYYLIKTSKVTKTKQHFNIFLISTFTFRGADMAIFRGGIRYFQSLVSLIRYSVIESRYQMLNFQSLVRYGKFRHSNYVLTGWSISIIS